MLRSSINALTKRWPSAAAQSLGIAIGRHELAVASVTSASGRPSLQWTRSLAAPEGLYATSPDASSTEALAAALVRLVPEACNKYVPVHIALPDPLGRLAVLDLDAVPTGERLRLQLVRWRMAQDLGLVESELEVAYQDLGNENQKRVLLGQAINREWLACVRAGLSRANITAWSLNQAICFRFNAFHGRLARAGRSGALLTLDPDAWTMAIWTAGGRLRFVRSRWRMPGDNDLAAELDLIAQDFERGVLAYVHGDAARTVDDVHISASAIERDALAGALNQRLQAACVPLAADVGDAAVGDPRSGSTDLALFAALAT